MGHPLINDTIFCTPRIDLYINNLTTSYYTDQSKEPSIVSAVSVAMFILAGLLVNLKLFSRISDVSAILDPKARLFLTPALSVFLPVTSYIFAKANNVNDSTSRSSYAAAAGAPMADLSLRAGLILTWMLLVEVLHSKVDEIRVGGYSAIIQRAGRVVWLGSLVLFSISTAGRKLVFIILWIISATKVAQRIAFTEVWKRSYASGNSSSVLTYYMAHMLREQQQEHHHHPADPAGDEHHDVEQGAQAQAQQGAGGSDQILLKRCNYIVMGEKWLVKKATAEGYELREITPNDCVITVGKVWELAQSDQLFALYDKNQRLRRLCLSFALFKLLHRRFEHLPAMTEEEARDGRNLLLNGLCNNNGETNKAAEALFEVMNYEVKFLCEYYHSFIPVVFASPFFLVANYFIVPVIVIVLCLMSTVLCGNGDFGYALTSLRTDNYTLQEGIPKIIVCLISNAANNFHTAFFALLDLSITVFLFIIFSYEEVWEFLVFLFSNWFMVSLLCSYTSRRYWRENPTISRAFRGLLCLRNKLSHGDLRLKQFSMLNLRWPLYLPLFAPLSMVVRTEVVPNSLKRSIMECLVEHNQSDTPLTTGKSALDKHGLSTPAPPPLAACDSVAEVILTWHIATSIMEVECPPTSKQDSSRVAMKLSRYCAYLVAFHPELLPDNKEKAERVFEDTKAELKRVLGCPAYFLSSKRARVKRIVKNISNTGSDEQQQQHAQAVAAAGPSDDQSNVVANGAMLARFLMADEADRGREKVWTVLDDVWTELIVYVAPSNDEGRVKGHEEVLVQGGEFLTVLWAITTHIGVARPPTKPCTTTTCG